MDIVRLSSDLKVANEISKFLDFVNEGVECHLILEKIHNKNIMSEHYCRQNELLIYNYYEPGTPLKEMLIENKKEEDISSSKFMLY